MPRFPGPGEPSEPGANVNCIQCATDADLNTKSTTFGNLINGPMPGLPTFPALPPELSGVTPKNLDSSYSQLSLQPPTPPPAARWNPSAASSR